jgi:CheY-like chemotaxis protein
MLQSQKTVLVVDDTPFNLQAACDVLRPHYKLRAATDGVKALALLSKFSDVDLILLDVMMPLMDGYEVCKRIKSDPRTSSIPVLFMSALDSAENEEKALAVGGVDMIKKPFQSELLLARIASHLD